MMAVLIGHLFVFANCYCNEYNYDLEELLMMSWNEQSLIILNFDFGFVWGKNYEMGG